MRLTALALASAAALGAVILWPGEAPHWLWYLGSGGLIISAVGTWTLGTLVSSSVAGFNRYPGGSGLVRTAQQIDGKIQIEWELPRWPDGVSVLGPGGPPTGLPELDAVCTVRGPGLLVHAALTGERTATLVHLVAAHGLRVENRRAIVRVPESYGRELRNLESNLERHIRLLNGPVPRLTAKRARALKPAGRRVRAAVALGESGTPLLKEVAHGRRHSLRVRSLAFDALWDVEPEDTRRAVQHWWSESDQPAEFETALELIGRRGGPEFLASLHARRREHGVADRWVDGAIARIRARSGSDRVGAMMLVEEAPGAVSLAEDELDSA